MNTMTTATNGFDFYPALGTIPTGKDVVPAMWWKAQSTLINLQHGNEYRNVEPLSGTWAESVRMFGQYRVVFFLDACRKVTWKFV